MKEPVSRRLVVRHYRDAEMQSVFANKSPDRFDSYCSVDMIVLRGRRRAISGQENHTNLPLLDGTFRDFLHILPLLDHQHIP